VSDEVSIRFEGLAELEQDLTAIGDEKRVKSIIRKALRAGAVIMQGAIEERAPERPDLPSSNALPVGALRADIVVTATTDETGALAVSVGPGKYTKHVASWVEYGHQMVQGGRLSLFGNGTGHRVGTHGMTSTFVPPHPFIRPAYEASREAAAEAIVESLHESVDDAKAKA
jgi:HK97 gp10 family phage protein